MKTKIQFKTEVVNDVELVLPYYSKTKHGTFYKVYGTETWECLRVTNNSAFTEVGQTIISNAVNDNCIECTEDEFKNALVETINKIQTI